MASISDLPVEHLLEIVTQIEHDKTQWVVQNSGYRRLIGLRIVYPGVTRSK